MQKCEIVFHMMTDSESRLAIVLNEGQSITVRLSAENSTISGKLKYISMQGHIFPYLEPDRGGEGIVITPVDLCSLRSE